MKGMSVKVYRRFMLMFLILVLTVGSSYFLLKYQQSQFDLAVTSNNVDDETYVIPGGMPIGIYLETEGVLILGTEEITSKDGSSKAPAKNLVKSGDYIIGIDDVEIKEKEELVEAVKQLDSDSVILHLRRDEEYIDVKVDPTLDEEGDYKLGIWVRDNAHGLGTITFIKEDYSFGALGHGIHDIDTNELLEISEGTLYETSIRNIKKGETGTPGGMEGVIVYNNYNILGDITQNTDTGVYGKIERIDRVIQNTKAVPAAKKEEIKTGPATILCAVSGQIESYEIEITGIDYYAREVNKGIRLKVTDEKLLEQTGGIVQGMSGSPIIQDGKLVGAVTHVLVNDPTKGYGIFIENMLEH